MEGEISTSVEAERDIDAESQKHRRAFMVESEAILLTLTLWAAPQ